MTVGQFRSFAREQAKTARSDTWRKALKPDHDEEPVVWVTPEDADDFCKWLSLSSPHEVSIPTDDQWELAARAGALNILPDPQPRFSANLMASELWAASCGQENKIGLVGVYGNAAELVSVEGRKTFQKRGGSFLNTVSEAQSATRDEKNDIKQSECFDDLGFRPVINWWNKTDAP